MKRDSVSAYVRMRRDTPLYAPVHILDDPSSFLHLRKYLMDGLLFIYLFSIYLTLTIKLHFRHLEIRLLRRVTTTSNL